MLLIGDFYRQIIFSGPLGSLSSFLAFILKNKKIEIRLSRCLGAWPVLHTSLLVMGRLNKTEFAIFISLMKSLIPRDLTNQNLFIFKESNISFKPPAIGKRATSHAIVENKNLLTDFFHCR